MTKKQRIEQLEKEVVDLRNELYRIRIVMESMQVAESWKISTCPEPPYEVTC